MAAISPHHLGNSSLKFGKDSKYMKIAPKDLDIVWGKDSRYWNVPYDENKAAELYQVCWLEVTSCVEGTSPEKNYEVGFQISFTPDAFGWGTHPIYVMVKRGKNGKFEWKRFNPNLKENGTELSVVIQRSHDQDSYSDNKLYFGLYEVWSGKWKGGLNIHNVFVRELP